MESKGIIIGIIGLGLIGGSSALQLKASGFASMVVGYDQLPDNLRQANDLGIIDKEVSINEMMQEANLIILAIPVDASKKLMVELLDKCSEHQVIIDFGSTKSAIAAVVINHKNRANYVACHPIAGTEHSGPKAAFSSLYNGKVNIICDKKLSSQKALIHALELTKSLGMRVKFMNSAEHDRHIAYVSHLSHISSFTLGQTVLEVEDDEENIFDLAGSGFESTVRLAKSSPAMWAPIFTDNAENIVEVLSAYITNLEKYKSMIKQKNDVALKRAMTEANRIRKVLESRTPLTNNR